MKLTRCGLAMAAALAFGFAQHAQAAAISGSMYEPFNGANYTAGVQVAAASALNSGPGWNATGAFVANDVNANWGNAAALPAAAGANKPVAAAGLTFTSTGYPAAIGRAATIGDGVANATNNVSRTLGSQLIDSGTTYFSFLTKRNNDTQRTTSFTFFGPANGVAGSAGNTPERFAIGQIGTTGGTAPLLNLQTDGNIGLFFNNSQPANPQPLPVGLVTAANPVAYGTNVTHLIVGRVDWNAGGNETVSIWVDPADVSTEAAMGAAYISTNGFELTSFNSIRLFSGNTAASNANFPAAKPVVSSDWDEIRISGTFAGAISTTIPEPTSAVLFALSGLALGAFRKRS